jgi:hypothetical protein
MNDLFNPAGLSILEDRDGAIAHGMLAPRVFYSRFVGLLSPDLCDRFVSQLDLAIVTAPPSIAPPSPLGTPGSAENLPRLAAFLVDLSALQACSPYARSRLHGFFRAERSRFSTLAILERPERSVLGARDLFTELGEPGIVHADPVEFDRALSNLAPAPRGLLRDLDPVWESSAP